MSLRPTTLGYVLLHIYEFDPGGAIYLPNTIRFEASTPCIIVASTRKAEQDKHRDCLNRGFTNWLNIAVVSDTCDDVVAQTEDDLVAAFNKDCEEGGWLWKMMNFQNLPESHGED